MQDRAQWLNVPGYPDLLFFRDAADLGRFYGFSSRPRLVREESGIPAIHLMLYGRKAGGAVHISGGQFTATYELGLRPDEQAAAEQFLGGAVTSPDWLKAQVRLDLISGLFVLGKPSMVGANTCTLMATLDAGLADKLRSAWSKGLPDASIRYEVSMRTTRTSRSQQQTRTSQRDAYGERTAATEFTFQRTTAEPLAMTLQGPAVSGPDELTGRMQTIGF
jgi:hypothetical protein